MIKMIPFTLEDAPALMGWIDSVELLMQFGGPNYSYPLTLDQISTIVQEPNRLAFSFWDIKANQLFGHGQILINEDDFRLSSLIIGHPNYRSQGLGAEITKELTHFGFQNTNHQVASLHVFDFNNAAIKAYQKIGFQVVPNWGKTRIVNTKAWNLIKMQLSKSDFYHQYIIPYDPKES